MSLFEPSVEHLGAAGKAKLHEATVSDVVKHPPVLPLTAVEYWLPADDGKSVRKVQSF